MVWKVCGEVVLDGLLLDISPDRSSEISSSLSSPKFKVRPELDVFGYV